MTSWQVKVVRVVETADIAASDGGYRKVLANTLQESIRAAQTPIKATGW